MINSQYRSHFYLSHFVDVNAYVPTYNMVFVYFQQQVVLIQQIKRKYRFFFDVYDQMTQLIVIWDLFNCFE